MMKALRGHFLGIAIAVITIIAPMTGVVSAQADCEMMHPECKMMHPDCETMNADDCKMMHFATFTPAVEIKLPTEFDLKAPFTLGTGNEINPLTENVTLHIGSFFTTIEGGSFMQKGEERFDFEGVVNGVRLDVRIEQLEDGSFVFKAEGEGADLGLLGTENSVMVGLMIGDDCGCTMVMPEFK